MASFLNRLFGRARKGSGATAKNRLHFVLQHDRINLPPERMEEMKREILAVIVKYLVVDQERVEIALEQRDRTHSKLVAEIPFAKEKQQIQMEARPETAGTDAQTAESNGAAKSPLAADEEAAPKDESNDSQDAEPVAEVDEASATAPDADAKDDKKN